MADLTSLIQEVSFSILFPKRLDIRKEAICQANVHTARVRFATAAMVAGKLRMMDGYQKDGSPRFKTFYGKTQKEVKLQT